MKLTINDALREGIKAHKSKNFIEADKLYTAILRIRPDHPDANHNMGVLAVDVGKLDAALPYFKAAVEVNPKVVQFWKSYIEVLIKLGRLNLAREIIKKAVENGIHGDFVYHYMTLIDQDGRNTKSQENIAKEPSRDKIQNLVKIFKAGDY